MAVLATDDFTRADNADLGADWTPLSDGNNGGDNFTIATNAAKASNASDSCERHVTATWPNDQWSEVIISYVVTPSSRGVGTGSGPAVRCATPGTVTEYRFVVSIDGWSLGRFSAGTHTEITNGSGTTFIANDVAYLEAQGSTLVAKKGTSAGVGGTTVTTQTDANIASGGAGIAHSTDEPDIVLLSWQGGDFAGGGAAPPPQRLGLLGVS